MDGARGIFAKTREASHLDSIRFQASLDLRGTLLGFVWLDRAAEAPLVPVL